MKRTDPPIMELTEAHADGTYFVDGEGDIWTACPGGCGWAVTTRRPFGQISEHGDPLTKFGPYVPVLDPAGNPIA